MPIRALVLGLAFAIMWSSAFTSARVIVAQAPPLSALALRFLISGLIGVALARAMGQSARLDGRQWRGVLIFGICQNALYLGLNFVAMQSVEASLAAIIASTMPLVVALAGWALFAERPGALALAGLGAGIAGVIVIMWSRIGGAADVGGVSLCVLGVLSLSVATLAVRGAASGGNLVMVVGLQMLVGAAVLAVPALLFESPSVTWSPSLVVAFVYTTLVPGLLATLVWFQLVHEIGAVRAATFHFLNPFFGVAIAALFLGERLGPLDALGVVVIGLGILAVQLARAGNRVAPAPVAGAIRRE